MSMAMIIFVNKILQMCYTRRGKAIPDSGVKMRLVAILVPEVNKQPASASYSVGGLRESSERLSASTLLTTH